MGSFSHLQESGEAAMVNVSGKVPSKRSAKVGGKVRVSHECLVALTSDAIHEICATARLAGIQASKHTATLIPLCHQIPIAGIEINATFHAETCEFVISAKAYADGVTGVEMEALVGASIAGLTIYDMVKAVDPSAVIGSFCLVEKTGGKNGKWTRTNDMLPL
jgi:cyclic pyranopterin phosphate synthase